MLTDEQIFDIIDGCASAELMQLHSHLMNNSLEYKQYFNELEAIHLDLAALPLEQTSVNFTEKVLAYIPEEKIVVIHARERVWSRKLTYIFGGTMVAMFLIAVGIIIAFQSASDVTGNSPDIFSKYVSTLQVQYFTKIAVLLNLIVILVVFDKKILRPYFRHRKVSLG